MSPLTHGPRTSLQAWHAEQQPLVRALATPVVEEMTSALEGIQTALDERDALLATVSAQLASLGARMVTLETGAHAREQVLTTRLETTTAQLETVTTQLETATTQLKTAKSALALSHERVTELTSKVEVATDRIHVLERQLFGPKSEKKKTPDARRGAQRRRQSELSEEERAQKRAAAAARRQAKLDALRTVVHRIKLPEGLLEGRELPPQSSVIYEWRPGELVRILVEREQRVLEDSGAIVTAPPVEQVVEGGSYGPALHAKVVTDKVLHSLPLRGQERIFGQLGAPLPMSTLGVLFHRTGELVHVLYLALLAHVRNDAHVAADDALDHDTVGLQPLIDDIGELFYIEELASERGLVGTAEHLALRQAKSQPVIDRIFERVDAYLEQAEDGRASVVKAVRYLQNQREPLSLFLSNVAVPIHNNLSERALRIVALLRKNSLFAGGDEPAQTYAELLSLLSIGLLHEVNPEHWLADVLLALTEPGLTAEDLLPWNWKASRGLTYKPYFDTA